MYLCPNWCNIVIFLHLVEDVRTEGRQYPEQELSVGNRERQNLQLRLERDLGFCALKGGVFFEVVA